jgi:hypothetical protein
MMSDFCKPRTVSAKTSPPICEVPNQCELEGGWSKAKKSSSSHRYFEKNGPTKASKNISTRITMPATANLLRMKRRRMRTPRVIRFSVLIAT